MVFAPNGRAAITYRVEVGVCLASGDPLGDPTAWPQAIDAWLTLCQAYGWAPGVMGASSAAAQAFREAGLNALELGDEAILHPDSFRLSGPDMKPVRQAVTRARRAGLTVRIRRHRDLSADEMAQVIKRADAWRDTETERGFSMALGRLGDPADGDCLLVEAVQEPAASDVVAMLSLVPWGTNGVSLDLMRRSPQSPNGTIELMVSELCLQSEDIGISRISLNFAMFRSAFEEGAQLGAGPVARLWRGLLVFFSRWWQLETLYRSNMKYQPEWVPRFACYEDARLIPRVGVASVIAEGFLVLPFAAPQQAAHRPPLSVPQTLVATGTAARDGTHARPQRPRGRSCSDDDDQPRLPEQVRVRMAKLKSLAGQRHRRLPGGSATEPHRRPGPRRRRTVPPSRSPGGCCACATTAGCSSPSCATGPAKSNCCSTTRRSTDGSTADFTGAIDLGDLVEVTGTMGAQQVGHPVGAGAPAGG